MIPLRDDNPHNARPVVTIAIMALCILVFLWQLSLDGRALMQVINSYGMVPAALFGQIYTPLDVPGWLGLVTHIFLHGGFFHLAGNMLYLWVFGDNIEAALGRGRFVLFFVLCGVSAALVQAGIAPASTIPMVGASGALAGVLGAYMVLFPAARIHVFLPIPFFFGIVRIRAFYLLGLWFVLQLFSGLLAPSDEPGVAFWAHIGGFVTGFGLIRLFVDRARLAAIRKAPRWVPERMLDRMRLGQRAGYRSRRDRSTIPGPWDAPVSSAAAETEPEAEAQTEAPAGPWGRRPREGLPPRRPGPWG